MRSEVFFFLLYFTLWCLVSSLLGEYYVSIDSEGWLIYPALFPWISGGFVVLYIVTVVFIWRRR